MYPGEYPIFTNHQINANFNNRRMSFIRLQYGSAINQNPSRFPHIRLMARNYYYTYQQFMYNQNVQNTYMNANMNLNSSVTYSNYPQHNYIMHGNINSTATQPIFENSYAWNYNTTASSSINQTSSSSIEVASYSNVNEFTSSDSGNGLQSANNALESNEDNSSLPDQYYPQMSPSINRTSSSRNEVASYANANAFAGSDSGNGFQSGNNALESNEDNSSLPDQYYPQISSSMNRTSSSRNEVASYANANAFAGSDSGNGFQSGNNALESNEDNSSLPDQYYPQISSSINQTSSSRNEVASYANANEFACSDSANGLQSGNNVLESNEDNSSLPDQYYPQMSPSINRTSSSRNEVASYANANEFAGSDSGNGFQSGNNALESNEDNSSFPDQYYPQMSSSNNRTSSSRNEVASYANANEFAGSDSGNGFQSGNNALESNEDNSSFPDQYYPQMSSSNNRTSSSRNEVASYANANEFAGSDSANGLQSGNNVLESNEDNSSLPDQYYPQMSPSINRTSSSRNEVASYANANEFAGSDSGNGFQSGNNALESNEDNSSFPDQYYPQMSSSINRTSSSRNEVASYANANEFAGSDSGNGFQSGNNALESNEDNSSFPDQYYPQMSSSNNRTSSSRNEVASYANANEFAGSDSANGLQSGNNVLESNEDNSSLPDQYYPQMSSSINRTSSSRNEVASYANANEFAGSDSGNGFQSGNNALESNIENSSFPNKDETNSSRIEVAAFFNATELFGSSSENDLLSVNNAMESKKDNLSFPNRKYLSTKNEATSYLNSKEFLNVNDFNHPENDFLNIKNVIGEMLENLVDTEIDSRMSEIHRESNQDISKDDKNLTSEEPEIEIQKSKENSAQHQKIAELLPNDIEDKIQMMTQNPVVKSNVYQEEQYRFLTSKGVTRNNRKSKITYNCRCFDCDASFDDLDQLLKHVEVKHHHEEKYNSNILWKMFACIYCTFCSSTFGNLQSHNIKIHRNLPNIYFSICKLKQLPKYSSQILGSTLGKIQLPTVSE